MRTTSRRHYNRDVQRPCNSNQLRFNELKESGKFPVSIFSDNEQELARVVYQKLRACHLTGAKLAGKSSSDILSQIAL